jgi:threonylcarbamoyladenosine tRNA methylthiotransferase MtaB
MHIVCPNNKNIKTVTLGCRFNFYESEVAGAIMRELDSGSDVVLVNTCSVTQEAERQSKQAVRKAIRENEGAKIIVTGCAAKTSKDYFEKLEGVSYIIQNDDKENFNEYKRALSCNNDSSDIDIFVRGENVLFKNKIRAFLQVQNGCDNFCTYCIVPFTRGRSRSLHLDDVIRRFGYFVRHGFKEIVLSGINITSYGRDLGAEYSLANLLKRLLSEYPSYDRIRISSIDPRDIDENLLDIMVFEPRIMPHFHLSIQSGDNETLRMMKRGHTREDVLRLCDSLKNKSENVTIGADLLVGLPFETKTMFENTLKLIDESGLSLIHQFSYSPRNGTVAARMVQHPKSVILERGRILRDKAQSAKLKMFRKLIGGKVSGIVEKSESGYSYGKTDSFVPFKLPGEIEAGELIPNMNVIGFDDDAIHVEN